MSAVAPDVTRWLWYPRIPIGALTVVFGQANVGKSTMMYDIIARLSRGDRMPLSALPPTPTDAVRNAYSLLAGLEDAPSRVAAVLDAAGAATDVIGIVEPEHFPDPRRSPLDQLPFLEAQIREFGTKTHGVRTLYLDNLTEAYVSTTESNNEASVRSALRPLADLAKRLDLAVVLNTHPKKGASAGDIREAITGSQAVFNFARSVLYVAPVPNTGSVAVSCAKSSYYPAHLVNTLAFRIMSESEGELDGHPVLGIPTVEWQPGVVPYTAQGLADANAAALEQRKKVAMRAAGAKHAAQGIEEDPVETVSQPPPPVPVVPPAPPQSVKERTDRFMSAETNADFVRRMEGIA